VTVGQRGDEGGDADRCRDGPAGDGARGSDPAARGADCDDVARNRSAQRRAGSWRDGWARLAPAPVAAVVEKLEKR
jgi:hypothetical protein